MNQGRGADRLERDIDVALARMPHWDPPPDFHRRLAAAAYRQEQLRRRHQPALRAGVLLQGFTRLTLVLMACVALAATAAWLVPWGEITTRSSILVWTSILVMFSYSAVLTWRQLRRPGRTASWSF